MSFCYKLIVVDKMVTFITKLIKRIPITKSHLVNTQKLEIHALPWDGRLNKRLSRFTWFKLTLSRCRPFLHDWFPVNAVNYPIPETTDPLNWNHFYTVKPVKIVGIVLVICDDIYVLWDRIELAWERMTLLSWVHDIWVLQAYAIFGVSWYRCKRTYKI